jgi:hypothetical protein
MNEVRTHEMPLAHWGQGTGVEGGGWSADAMNGRQQK